MSISSCRYCRLFETPDCFDGFNCFEPAPESDILPTFKPTTKQRRYIKAEQQVLIDVQPDYSKITKQLPPQQEITDLPLFSTDFKTEQLSLF